MEPSSQKFLDGNPGISADRLENHVNQISCEDDSAICELGRKVMKQQIKPIQFILVLKDI